MSDLEEIKDRIETIFSSNRCSRRITLTDMGTYYLGTYPSPLDRDRATRIESDIAKALGVKVSLLTDGTIKISK